jgi:hypothetical protein
MNVKYDFSLDFLVVTMYRKRLVAPSPSFPCQIKYTAKQRNENKEQVLKRDERQHRERSKRESKNTPNLN